MNYKATEQMMIDDEGETFILYKDSRGFWTIGIGYCIEKRGISKKMSRMLFREVYNENIRDLDHIFTDVGFHTLPDNIQMVLFNMRYQLGYTGFRGFRRMIQAVKKYNWEEMIVEMKDSKWYHNFQDRADRLIALINEEINYG